MCTFVLRQSGRDWTFTLLERSGKLLMRGKPHATRAFAVRAIDEIRELRRDNRGFQRGTTPGGLHTFAVIALDGRTLAVSSFFNSPGSRDLTLERCRAAAADAPIAEDAWAAMEILEKNAASSLDPYPAPPANLASPRGEHAAIRLETSNAGYRLVLFDQADRWLMATPHRAVLREAIEILDQFRIHATSEQAFEPSLFPDGRHGFVLRDAGGQELAASEAFASLRERDDRLARARAAAHTLPPPIVVLPRSPLPAMPQKAQRRSVSDR